MGYFDILNRDLIEYLCLHYSQDVEIQALLDSYKEGEDLELFEAVDREILYEFIEHTKMYTDIFNKDDIDEILNEEYISYFMDCSLSEIYKYFEEVSIIDVLIMTDIYKYDDMYYLVWYI